uniref:Uncharacterized protein n=1 Tax=Mycena chlorophos TaxID=658473 RepID=A0ABQ0KW92_MYCCL|nr:predicted protein [Mycena chlorophos]
MFFLRATGLSRAVAKVKGKKCVTIISLSTLYAHLELHPPSSMFSGKPKRQQQAKARGQRVIKWIGGPSWAKDEHAGCGCVVRKPVLSTTNDPQQALTLLLRRRCPSSSGAGIAAPTESPMPKPVAESPSDGSTTTRSRSKLMDCPSSSRLREYSSQGEAATTTHTKCCHSGPTRTTPCPVVPSANSPSISSSSLSRRGAEVADMSLRAR